MEKILVVVDMQNDFVDGALGSPEARAIVPNVVSFINAFSGRIFATLDTHEEDYLSSNEGRHLPVRHCIRGTDGARLHPDIASALDGRDVAYIEKNSFGCVELPVQILGVAGDEPCQITLVGLCTDVCVVSNALSLKSYFPESDITVIADCCAGITPEGHEAAIATMRSCQIEIL